MFDIDSNAVFEDMSGYPVLLEQGAPPPANFRHNAFIGVYMGKIVFVLSGSSADVVILDNETGHLEYAGLLGDLPSPVALINRVAHKITFEPY